MANYFVWQLRFFQYFKDKESLIILQYVRSAFSRHFCEICLSYSLQGIKR